MPYKGGKIMRNKIEVVAFDLGGVLAYRDLSSLTEEELILLKTYLHRRNIQDRDLLEQARRRIDEIYLKIHRLNAGAVPTLEMLKDLKIRPSIWTNNIREIDNWFEEIGLYKYIRREDIVNSFDIGSDKPDLEFYRRALELLSNKPNDVLFFDDDKRNIEGARLCNIDGIEYDMSQDLEKTVEEEIRRRL